MSSFVPSPTNVTLGRNTYNVRPLKFKYLIPLKKELGKLLRDIDTVLDLSAILREYSNPNANIAQFYDNIGQAIDVIIGQVGPVLKMAIPEIDVAVFSQDASDEDSPDIEQIFSTIDAVVKANHLEYVKNLFPAGNQNSTKTTSSPDSVTSTATQ